MGHHNIPESDVRSGAISKGCGASLEDRLLFQHLCSNNIESFNRRALKELHNHD